MHTHWPTHIVNMLHIVEGDWSTQDVLEHWQAKVGRQAVAIKQSLAHDSATKVEEPAATAVNNKKHAVRCDQL